MTQPKSLRQLITQKCSLNGIYVIGDLYNQNLFRYRMIYPIELQAFARLGGLEPPALPLSLECNLNGIYTTVTILLNFIKNARIFL
ncbi:Uncharacterised protein [Moraxella bovis]|uniref:Uncharacterized protein n=2 Tax=Moraxella bovis TaxID=476 RepID=A0A378PP48_MORBO|nr:Uncharacterised protein [Moraxella bovis]